MEKATNTLRQPDFNNILRVLEKKKPNRPTLFEFFLNEPLYEQLANEKIDNKNPYSRWIVYSKAYMNAGYDYVTVLGSDFSFPAEAPTNMKTYSINEGGVINDRKSYREYPWPDPDDFDYSRLDETAKHLPGKMKIIVWGPGGVLENVIKLTGYETLCMLLYDDPGLVGDIFEAVGSRLVRFYEICGKYKNVGAMISNDDWGFNKQTMLSVEDMEKYVFPYHIEIAKTIHNAGKPAILHSCGQLEHVMDSVIYRMKYDGKHSFEDKILPVEDAYRKWGGKIAILGGIDMDFLCRSKPNEILDRSAKLLELSRNKGSYALGSGNSIPEYVPYKNYFAMINARTR